MGRRNNWLATGLVLGISFAFVVFFYADIATDIGSCIKDGVCDGYAEKYHEKAESERPRWWAWARFWFIAEDTTAQWIMALFTVGAFWVLLHTLAITRESNKFAVEAARAANEANQIMRNEQRPWVTVLWNVPCQFEVTDGGRLCRIKWLYDFENKGKSPAFNVHHEWDVLRLDESFVGRGADGRDAVIDKALRNLRSPSTTPVLYPGAKTAHLWGEPQELPIEGDEAGTLYLCACLTYALDQERTRFSLEARAYVISEAKDLPGGMTHEILSVSRYERIETWDAKSDPQN